ncbi:MAG: zinc ribbon domain-containing protein [Spirochaetes bacterium]|nr:zinc ribbon domain-containing protein [Spirochaetota bacterium]
MPTYDYLCDSCGHRFEQNQGITEPPVDRCPECGEAVRRLITGGGGFIMKGSGVRHGEGACSLERTGQTCCGRSERCGRSSCGDA